MEGRKRISLSGILKSKASDNDKIWLVVRLLPADKAIKFAKWCANGASHIDNTKTLRAAAKAAKATGAAISAAHFTDAAVSAGYVTDAAFSAAHATATRVTATEVGDDAIYYGAIYGTVYNDVYDKARRNQITQLKLIVKENNL